MIRQVQNKGDKPMVNEMPNVIFLYLNTGCMIATYCTVCYKNIAVIYICNVLLFS